MPLIQFWIGLGSVSVQLNQKLNFTENLKSAKTFSTERLWSMIIKNEFSVSITQWRTVSNYIFNLIFNFIVIHLRHSSMGTHGRVAEQPVHVQTICCSKFTGKHSYWRQAFMLSEHQIWILKLNNLYSEHKSTATYSHYNCAMPLIKSI